MKEKITKLYFWNQVSIAPVEQEEKTAITNNSVSELKVKTETKKEKQVLVPFPASPKVYHFHPIAFMEQMKMMENSFDIIFPLDVKPQNSPDNSLYKGNEWTQTSKRVAAVFGSNRDSGKRKHAGRDLYASWGMPVRAMADGVVIDVRYWSSMKVGVVAIAHKTSSGRSFVARYCEVNYKSIAVKEREQVKQGDLVARVDFIMYYGSKKNRPPKLGSRQIPTNMLHLELYSNGEDHSRPEKALLSKSKYARSRSDLIDPLEILQEAYENNFVKSEPKQPNRVTIQNLHISDAGIEFIKMFEGDKFKIGDKHIAYDDAPEQDDSNVTIGYGHVIAFNALKREISYSSPNEIKNGITKHEFENGITERRATELLKQDLINSENGVKRHINVPLNQNEFDALVSLSFNTGPDVLGVKGKNNGDTKVKILINKGDYWNGIDELSDITEGNDLGLVKRRQAEITIFKSNYYTDEIP